LRAFRKRVLIDLRWPDAERFDGNNQPSCLALHLARRISKTLPLIGINRRPSAVLLSGTKITRFCQSRFSMRIWKSSLSFLIPVSRIKMTISQKSSRVRCRHLQANAPAMSFFSASSSSQRCRPCSFIILIFGAWLITFYSCALCSIRRNVRNAQLAFAAEPGNLNCSEQSPVIWSIRNSVTDVAFSNRQLLRWNFLVFSSSLLPFTQSRERSANSRRTTGHTSTCV